MDSFEIEYVSEIELNNEQTKKIGQAIDLYLETNLNFIFTRKKVLDRSNRGKLKQFQSML